MAEHKRYRSKLGIIAPAIAALLPNPNPASAAAGQMYSLCLAGPDVITPDRLWTSWSFAPEVIVPLALLALFYAGALRPAANRHPQPRRRTEVVLFAAGYGLLAVALVSPLCRLAATLASAHMVQHVILVTVAPALLVFGTPMRILPRIFQVPAPLWLSALVYGVAIWAWHVPSAYQAALLNAPTHLAMYATLLFASLMFWQSVLLSARGSVQRTAAAILVLLVTLIHTGMLGALLSFSQHAWYPLMSPGAVAWRLSSLEDQQLAGLIMWVPMGAIYLITAVALIGHKLARLHEGETNQLVGSR